MRMMERMADFSHILTTRPDFDDEDREWLHHLVADWQVIADLSFADLLLILQNGEGKYIIAEQCRPSTVMSLRADDVVGDVVEEEMSAELDAAMASESVFRSTVLRTVGESTVCNDAYGAVKIALALADAFGCGVNDLPLSLVLSWYEQKAVCILLTLLYLGIKNIRLGPTLPAFVSPNVLNYLVENFGIAPITTPEEDLKALLKR